GACSWQTKGLCASDTSRTFLTNASGVKGFRSYQSSGVSREFELHWTGNDSSLVTAFQQELDRRPATLPIVNRVIIHVHSYELVGQRFSHPASVFHRMPHRDFTISEAILN